MGTYLVSCPCRYTRKMKCRSLLAAAIVPLALGDNSYSYDYTDSPTAAPTVRSRHPRRADQSCEHVWQDGKA